MLRVAIVDDHPIIMEGIKMLLQHESNINIVGTFVDGKGVFSYLESNEVDIILLDISLPDVSGIDFCKLIKNQWPNIIILILSNHTERSLIVQAIQNGASGYLLKNASLEELKHSIQEAVDGRVVFSKAVNEIISRPSRNELTGIPRLTKREKQILKMIAEGKTSNTIADELFLSPLTISTHRKNLIQKFKVKNIAELIMEANQQKLL